LLRLHPSPNPPGLLADRPCDREFVCGLFDHRDFEQCPAFDVQYRCRVLPVLAPLFFVESALAAIAIDHRDVIGPREAADTDSAHLTGFELFEGGAAIKRAIRATIAARLLLAFASSFATVSVSPARLAFHGSTSLHHVPPGVTDP
jgi:hypothetical protein